MENLQRIKELVNELKQIIDEIEKQEAFKSEMNESFQGRLSKKLEKKNKEYTKNHLSNEL